MTITALCSECLHPRPDRHRPTCTTQLGQLFATIDERQAMLDIRRQQTEALGEGNSPGFTSSPPISLTVRAHQDPASLPWRVGPDDQDRPGAMEEHEANAAVLREVHAALMTGEEETDRA